MAFLTRTYSFTDGTTAYGSQVDSEIANIVNTLNNCDSGSTTWTNVKVTTLLPQADVNMGGHKVTGLANGSASTDAVAYGQISNISIVTGSVIMYPIKTAPTGYLYCDGSAVGRGTYSTLYGIIGNTFGSGDGATTFNLPDYRGKFIRGVDDGTGNDPDVSSRTAQTSGGNTGNAAGSCQGYGNAAHTHTTSVTDPGHNHTLSSCPIGGNAAFITVNQGNGSINATYTGTTVIASNTTGVTVGVNSQGASDARPINSSLYFHIKI